MESHMEASNDQRMYQVSPTNDSVDPSSTHMTGDDIRAHFD
jgi:hypothetical protein